MTLRVHPDEIVRTSDSQLLAVHPSWERVRLSDVAEILNGFPFRSAQFSNSDGTPLLRIRDVGHDSTETRFVGAFDERYIIAPGSIVVGMDGDFRVARWTGPRALLNQRVCKISVPRPNLYDESFLLYALPGYLDAINALTSSVTVKHLSSRTIRDIPLPLPPLVEQHRIVAAIEEQFSRLDAGVEMLDRALLLSDAMRRSVLNAVLGSIHQTRSLADLAHTQLGKMLSAKSRTGVGGRPYLRNKNVQWGRIDLDDVLVMDFSERDVEKFLLAPGDVLVCEGGEVGRSAIWRGGIEGCCYQKALHRVRVGKELLPEYLVHVMRWLAEGNRFEAYVTGSTIKHLPQEDLRRIPIPTPTLEKQRVIVAELEQQLSVIAAMRSAIEGAKLRSASLRRSILERAFRGELVPQDPSDEPASVLLDRICAERPILGRAPARRRVSV